MGHGGDIYRNQVELDFSVSLNPYPVPQSIRDAAEDGIRKSMFYPDVKQESLRNALADLDGVAFDEVFAGNGASELLLAAVRSIRPRRVLVAEPGFTGYRSVLGSLLDCSVTEYVLREENDFVVDKKLPLQGMDLLFLTDPWNPTGRNISGDVLKHLLARAKEEGVCTILDQSFLHLSDKADVDAHDLLREYEDLILIRSFTKLFALPGIRMGYVIANNDRIAGIQKQLPEWNLSAIAGSVMEEGARLIKGSDFCERSRELIRKEREYLQNGLKKWGIRVYQSDANYMLIRSEEDLYTKLLTQKILIRDCSDFPHMPDHFFRIAVKDHESNRKLLDTLQKIL